MMQSKARRVPERHRQGRAVGAHRGSLFPTVTGGLRHYPPPPYPRGRRGHVRPRYGLHALRHWYASFLIDQGLPPKRIQTAMGHSSITMTFDRYRHLFPALDDGRAKVGMEAAAI